MESFYTPFILIYDPLVKKLNKKLISHSLSITFMFTYIYINIYGVGMLWAFEFSFYIVISNVIQDKALFSDNTKV